MPRIIDDLERGIRRATKMLAEEAKIEAATAKRQTEERRRDHSQTCVCGGAPNRGAVVQVLAREITSEPQGHVTVSLCQKCVVEYRRLSDNPRVALWPTLLQRRIDAERPGFRPDAISLQSRHLSSLSWPGVALRQT